MPQAQRLDPVAEFEAMSEELHEAARFWLAEGYYPPGVSSAQIERLDGWLMRISTASPEILATLRAAAGIALPTRAKRRRTTKETIAEPG
jgi:hypothetical protein